VHSANLMKIQKYQNTNIKFIALKKYHLQIKENYKK
jgi:hypothetical protein